MLRPVPSVVGCSPPLRIHRASGVFDDTFECSSFTLMVRSDVEGESDDVGDDVAAAVPLDCRGTAAARVFFSLFVHFSSFLIVFFVY